MAELYCKCNTCNSIFNDQVLLESPCPFCGDSLSYKEIDNIKKYFKPELPKLNNPMDFILPTRLFDKLPFNQPISRNYLTRNQNSKYHILNVIPVCKFINNRSILINLCIVWDNDFNNKAYSILPDPTNSLLYKLDSVVFENLFFDRKENMQIRVFTKIVPDECYERFLRNYEEFKNSFDNSDLFSLYNSINWELLDSEKEQKTYYEYASINYLLHIFELIHVPNIDIIDFDIRLLSFESIIYDMNFVDSVGSENEILSADKFLEKYVNNKMSPYLEGISFEDYEDIYDYFGSYLEGAVAPNAVGLNTAAQRSSAVFNKLYDLGYNPKMQIYSLGETTSLCPTFEKDGTLYYIECNNNIMKGINEFESVEDMKEIMNEVYNDYNDNSLFLTIEGLTSDVLTFILNNAKSNKEFLTRLIDLNNKKREEFIYSHTVQDEEDFKNSIISEFDIVPMTPQTLFKYGKTHFKLRNCQKLAGDEHGFMFIDKNGIIAGYIIVQDKIYQIPIGTRTIPTVTSLEAASDYKLKGIEMAMVDYYKKKTDTYNLRIECRNFDLRDRIVATEEYKKIDSDKPFTLFETITEEEPLVLNEAINANKRKQIEEKIYKTFDLLDKTGANTQKYKTLFKSMSDDKFDKYIKEFLADDKKNFYLEVLPNKNCPRIKDCKEALDYLKVPAEEYIYYRQDGHEKDPIRSRYKVPVLYINLRRLQQMLSKKNTYSLDINKRNMKTGQVTADDKIARISDMETFSLLTYKEDPVALREFLGPRAKILVLNFFNCWKLLRAF
jgi:hypothetical protein